MICGGVCGAYTVVCDMGAALCARGQELTPEQRERMMRGLIRVAHAISEPRRRPAKPPLPRPLWRSNRILRKPTELLELRLAVLGREALRGAGVYLDDAQIDRVLALDIGLIGQLRDGAPLP